MFIRGKLIESCIDSSHATTLAVKLYVAHGKMGDGEDGVTMKGVAKS